MDFIVVDNGTKMPWLCESADLRAALRIGGWRQDGRWWIEPSTEQDSGRTSYGVLCSAVEALLIGNDETGFDAIGNVLPYVDRLASCPNDGPGYWLWSEAEITGAAIPVRARRLTVSVHPAEMAILRAHTTRSGIPMSRHVRGAIRHIYPSSDVIGRLLLRESGGRQTWRIRGETTSATADSDVRLTSRELCCPDCSAELRSAELGYVPGALECRECGSLFGPATAGLPWA